MELGLLSLLVVICITVTQLLLVPVALLHAFQLPHFLWLDSLQNWLVIGVVLLVGAWLVGER